MVMYGWMMRYFTSSAEQTPSPVEDSECMAKVQGKSGDTTAGGDGTLLPLSCLPPTDILRAQAVKIRARRVHRPFSALVMCG